MSGTVTKSSLLAWSLFAIVFVVLLFSLPDILVNLPADQNLFDVIVGVLLFLVVIVFCFLAALIISRRPGNVIGWLMMVPALALTVMFQLPDYPGKLSAPPASPSPLLILAVVFTGHIFLFLLIPLLFTMLLFPDGRLPSHRWRWVLWAGIGWSFSIFLSDLFSPTISLVDGNEDWIISNPIGFLPAGIGFLVDIGTAVMILVVLICAAAPFVRYRRATGVEREQIKWLLYACGLFVFIFFVGIPFSESSTIINDIWSVLLFLAILAFPAAIAIAILRYRLWDINIIIHRTLVYGTLTIVLAAVYIGSILLLQAIFSAISGQQSPVAIVISTLVIAALFNPLRHRIQAAIDRRFFRRKYDAVQTLEQFALTARDEVDLDQLAAELVNVVNETMQPQRVMLWLKEDKE